MAVRNTDAIKRRTEVHKDGHVETKYVAVHSALGWAIISSAGTIDIGSMRVQKEQCIKDYCFVMDIPEESFNSMGLVAVEVTMTYYA